MGRKEDAERVHAEDVRAWRRWLSAHHSRTEGIWLVSWKKATGRPSMTYDEAVANALCFGWIDSVTAALDDERSMLWFSPRRPGSGWSRPNKQRIEAMEAAGRMHDAGRAVVAQAKADGSWSLLDAVEDLVVPDDLAAAFDRHPGSEGHWASFPRSVRRGILEWIVQATRPQTRERRIEETARLAARGERANQWRGPKGP